MAYSFQKFEYPLYSFFLLFHDYAFGNGRIHFMDLRDDLLKLTKYVIKLAKNLNFFATDWL